MFGCVLLSPNPQSGIGPGEAACLLWNPVRRAHTRFIQVDARRQALATETVWA